MEGDLTTTGLSDASEQDDNRLAELYDATHRWGKTIRDVRLHPGDTQYILWLLPSLRFAYRNQRPYHRARQSPHQILTSRGDMDGRTLSDRSLPGARQYCRQHRYLLQLLSMAVVQEPEDSLSDSSILHKVVCPCLCE